MLCLLNSMPSSNIELAWKAVAKLRCGKHTGAVFSPLLQCTQYEAKRPSNSHAAGGATPLALVHCLLHDLHGTAPSFSTIGAMDV